MHTDNISIPQEAGVSQNRWSGTNGGLGLQCSFTSDAEVSQDFWSPSLLAYAFSSLVFSVRHVIISQFDETWLPKSNQKKKKPNLD